MKKNPLKLDVKKSTLRHLDEVALRATRGGGLPIKPVNSDKSNSQSIPSQRTSNSSGAC